MLAFLGLPAADNFFDLHLMQLPITHPAHLVVVDMVANGASGGLMLRGDLLAYSLVAISTPSGLILVAIHTEAQPARAAYPDSRVDQWCAGLPGEGACVAFVTPCNAVRPHHSLDIYFHRHPGP